MIDIKQVQAVIDGLGPVEVEARGVTYKVEFQAKASQSGNVQIVFKDMRVPDTAKCYALVAVDQALSEAGLNSDIRFTFRGQAGAWQSFPCLWVNEAREAQNAASNERISALEARIDALLGVLEGRQQAAQPETQTYTDVPLDEGYVDEMPL